MIEEIIKILVAFAVAAVLGVERRKRNKPVGLRTLSLVCIGSTLAVIVAINHFPQDIGRILAGILTGIGFLGAGAILSRGKDVLGLTTAATIWTVAIIGVVIGLGEYVLAVVVTLLSFIILEISLFTKPLKR